MNACCVPFIIEHSHTALVRFSCCEARVVKEASSNGKHREGECDESCLDPSYMRVVSVVHQQVVLPQERRLVHNGKQKVEAGKISLDLFQPRMVRSNDIMKDPDEDGERKNFGGKAYQCVGQIAAWVLDFLNPREGTDLAEEHRCGEIQFVDGRQG
jgi:hypothetical protein